MTLYPIPNLSGTFLEIVIDGRPGHIISSTFVDCTSGKPQLIREGAGPWEYLL